MFITTPAHFSVELNAHSLLGICLLVAQKQLPESALSISNYHSQSCESTFRLTRSMSGAFSSIVNFTIEQFLKRAVSCDDIETYSSDDEYDYKYKIDPSANVEEEDTSDDEDNL
ncbi:unnamed protein product, partial [Rotaria magnacalcarata]